MGLDVQLEPLANKVLEKTIARVFREVLRFVDYRQKSLSHTADSIFNQSDSGDDLENIERELHIYLRECWDGLDGVGRLINTCLYPRFPESGLLPPEEMTRQCTFYTVRRDLHNNQKTCEHPLSNLIWTETSRTAASGYKRLSYLYNISLFFPLPVERSGLLAGVADLPAHYRSLIRQQNLEECTVKEAVNEIGGWLKGFIAECYAEIEREFERRLDPNSAG